MPLVFDEDYDSTLIEPSVVETIQMVDDVDAALGYAEHTERVLTTEEVRTVLREMIEGNDVDPAEPYIVPDAEDLYVDEVALRSVFNKLGWIPKRNFEECLGEVALKVFRSYHLSAADKKMFSEKRPRWVTRFVEAGLGNPARFRFTQDNLTLLCEYGVFDHDDVDLLERIAALPRGVEFLENDALQRAAKRRKLPRT